MGGNALRHTQTRRYDASEYHELAALLTEKLKSALPDCRIAATQAYFEKSSFGDLDIMIEDKNAKQRLIPQLESIGFGEVSNRAENRDEWFIDPVWSVGYNDFQVDLMFQDPEHFDSAFNYFSFNDLGNLIGGVARKMGLKFGHKGLMYTLNIKDVYRIAEISITKDFKEALEFLGFDHERYLKGFKNLEEIFQFVADSKYFNKTAYILEYRNYKARTRDAKRPTYTKFLSFIKDLPDKYEHFDQNEFLEKAKAQFPDFHRDLNREYEKFERKKIAKSKCDGALVAQLTGLKHVPLGDFFKAFKEHVQGTSGDFYEWAFMSLPEEIEQSVLKFFSEKYQK